jgi:hypothetical protein
VKDFDLSNPRVLGALGLGLVGGLFLGKEAVAHLFVEGLTAAERKGMLIFGGSIVGLWAAKELLDLDPHWYSAEPWMEDAGTAIDQQTGGAK